LKSIVRYQREVKFAELFRQNALMIPIIGDITEEVSLLRDALLLAFKAAGSIKPTLIRGETGTGKENIARAIWRNSPRKGKPFLILNCAGVGEELAVSTLFGHKKGAFTGATMDQIGLFQAAEGGILFLDEFFCLSPECQKMILRVVETGEVMALGARQISYVDVKIIAASNDGTYEIGEDLYSRFLHVIDLPLLRQRKQDIPLLVDHFLRQYSGGRIFFSDEAMQVLMRHQWPMNVRELEMVVIRAIETADLFSFWHVGVDDLEIDSLANASIAEIDAKNSETDVIKAVAERFCDPEDDLTLSELTKELYRATYLLCGGNADLAGRLMGATGKTIRKYTNDIRGRRKIRKGKA